jgi:hypothetical protein
VELSQHRDEVKLHGDVARLREQQKASVAPVDRPHKRRQRVGGTSVRGVRVLEAEVLGQIRKDARAQPALTLKGATDGHDSICGRRRHALLLFQLAGSILPKVDGGSFRRSRRVPGSALAVSDSPRKRLG